MNKQAFVTGFIKRANDHGINNNDAVAILKQAATWGGVSDDLGSLLDNPVSRGLGHAANWTKNLFSDPSAPLEGLRAEGRKSDALNKFMDDSIRKNIGQGALDKMHGVGQSAAAASQSVAKSPLLDPSSYSLDGPSGASSSSPLLDPSNYSLGGDAPKSSLLDSLSRRFTPSSASTSPQVSNSPLLDPSNYSLGGNAPKSSLPDSLSSRLLPQDSTPNQSIPKSPLLDPSSMSLGGESPSMFAGNGASSSRPSGNALNEMISQFRKYHGTDYDPNSSLDRRKLNAMVSASRNNGSITSAANDKRRWI